MAKRRATTLSGGKSVLPDGSIKDPSNPTQLGPSAEQVVRQPPPGPLVDPRITDPNVRGYAERIAQKQAQKGPAPIPRYQQPVAGGVGLPIPHLDSEHQDGMTMQEQAVMQATQAAVGGQMFGQPSPQTSPGGIIQGGLPTPAALGSSASLGIVPSDTLPPAAQQDPEFQHGMGGMVAAAQPKLAQKYGVVRNGEFIPPQKLGNGQRKLSDHTAEGLKAIADFNSQRKDAEEGGVDQKIAAEAQQGPAGQAADVKGKAPRKGMTDQDRKDLLDDMDEFDLTRFRDSVMRDMLNNDEQRDIIEARLKPLDLTDLIVRGRVSQLIPIKEGMFEPELQSYSGEEDLAIKRLITEESKSLEPSDRYLLDKYSIMGLTIALSAVNKKQLPSYQDASGNFDDKKFWVKFNIVQKFPYHMLASLAVNWFWFDMRVRQLFKADNVGNG